VVAMQQVGAAVQLAREEKLVHRRRRLFPGAPCTTSSGFAARSLSTAKGCTRVSYSASVCVHKSNNEGMSTGHKHLHTQH
jgi:hypothetical protein